MFSFEIVFTYKQFYCLLLFYKRRYTFVFKVTLLNKINMKMLLFLERIELILRKRGKTKDMSTTLYIWSFQLQVDIQWFNFRSKTYIPISFVTLIAFLCFLTIYFLWMTLQCKVQRETDSEKIKLSKPMSTLRSILAS